MKKFLVIVFVLSTWQWATAQSIKKADVKFLQVKEDSLKKYAVKKS